MLLASQCGACCVSCGWTQPNDATGRRRGVVAGTRSSVSRRSPRLRVVPRGHHEVGAVGAALRAAKPQLGQRHVAAPSVDDRLQAATKAKADATKAKADADAKAAKAEAKAREKEAKRQDLTYLKSLLAEFKFAEDDNVSLAGAISMLMTPVLRGMMPAAPIHAITKPDAGSGGSYMQDLTSAIATGERPSSVRISDSTRGAARGKQVCFPSPAR
jgi:hypothetical protein